MMITLKDGSQTQISESDAVAVAGLTLYRGHRGYVQFSIWRDGRNRTFRLHRFLLAPPAGTHVDHINGDKLDNRRENLRIVTPSVNQANRKRLNKNNTSGIRGIRYEPHRSPVSPWRAQIAANRKVIHIGLFATRDQAIAARRAAELELFGELCPDIKERRAHQVKA